jgi:hypothetical protein
MSAHTQEIRVVADYSRLKVFMKGEKYSFTDKEKMYAFLRAYLKIACRQIQFGPKPFLNPKTGTGKPLKATRRRE